MKKLLLLFIPVTIFYACDKVKNAYPTDAVNTAGIIWDDSLYVSSSPTLRKIVIEEYTGHLCTFCPDGAREIERLDSVYSGQILPISFHAGNFADVPANGVGFDANGDGVMDYTTDFKTTTGSDYYTTFGVSSNPAGAVSRLNNGAITGKNQWETDVLTIKNDVPKVSIGLSSLYDDSTRTAKAVVTTNWQSSTSGNYNIQIQLVEDSIVAWQLDNGVHTQFYMHRHVFRKAMNGTWGSPLPSSNVGDTNTQEFAITLDPSWNVSHCMIVAYVYQIAPSYEILQGEKVYLLPH